MNKIIRIFVLAALFLAPIQAHASILDIKEITTPSGITAWLVEDPSVPVISMRFALMGTGSIHDPQNKQGLTRIASNMFDEGAGDMDSKAFQKKLRDESITLRFNAGRDTFGGELKTITARKTTAFSLLKTAIEEPRFDEEPLKRMVAANKSRIKQSLSDPKWIAARLLNDRAYAGHPYAFNSGGTLRTLDNITQDDLRNFAKTRLSKDRLRVSIVGDITQEQATELIDRVFGSLPSTSSLPETPSLFLQNQGKTYLYETDIPQTIINILQVGVDAKSPDYQTAQVMNFILGGPGFGSRLTEEIREKRGLTYGIHSSMQELEKVATLSVSTSTANNSAAEMMALIRKEWEKMASSTVSETELQNAKTYLIDALPLSLTSTSSIAGMMLSMQMDDRSPDYLSEREEKIRAVKAQDIQNLSEYLLKSEDFLTILVGQPSGIEDLIVLESIPNAQ